MLAGIAIHLASLWLPFLGFKCDAPQPYFSLRCAIPGFLYLALPLLDPARHIGLSVLACSWGLPVLVGALSAITGRLRLAGSLAALLVLPTFAVAITAVPPDRWFGPTCSAAGAFLVLVGGILGVRSR